MVYRSVHTSPVFSVMRRANGRLSDLYEECTKGAQNCAQMVFFLYAKDDNLACKLVSVVVGSFLENQVINDLYTRS